MELKLTDAVVVGGVPGIDCSWVHEPTEKKKNKFKVFFYNFWPHAVGSQQNIVSNYRHF
jgi:hypothetical protein